jgi:hypothetical protein
MGLGEARCNVLALSILLGAWLAPPALASVRITPDPRVLPLARQVLQTLRSTPLGQTAPALPNQIVIVNGAPNAILLANGVLEVTASLALVLRLDRGVWAAALAHELGHAIEGRPEAWRAFREALRQEYAQARQTSASPSPLDALLDRLDHGWSGSRQSQDRELVADVIGLLLMAEAGYQPEFSAILDQRMRACCGDSPRLIALLAAHPRWSTREGRTRAFFDVAETLFRWRYPDAARSPGGMLPPEGRITALRAAPDERDLVLEVSYEIQNPAQQPLRLAAVLLDRNGRHVATDLAPYRSVDGSLVVYADLPAPPPQARRSASAALRIPWQAVSSGEPRLRAVVFLLAGEDSLDRWTVRVHPPR